MSEQTPITLPWGMVETASTRTASPAWVGVTGDGRTLVLDRDDDRPAVAVRLPVIPAVPDAHRLALEATGLYLDRITARGRGGYLRTDDPSVDDVVSMMICAGQGVGDAHEGDQRWLDRRLADGMAMPWTIDRWRWARRGPVQVPSMLDRGGEPATTTFALAGLRAADSKRPAERWGAAEPGTRHTGATTAYGIALAPSSLVLVDLDVKHDDADGPAAWEGWLTERGLTAPPTLTVRTASGGVHLIYRAHPTVHVRSHDGVLPGVDIKGGHISDDGSRVGQGMAVGPGSRVRRGDSPDTWGEYLVVCDLPPAVLPEDLAEALAELTAKRPPKRRGAGAGAPTPLPMVDAEHLDARRWDRLRRMEDAIRECAPGTRHDTINREVYGAIMVGCPPELVEAIALEAIRVAGIVEHDHDVPAAIADALAAREAEEVGR